MAGEEQGRVAPLRSARGQRSFGSYEALLAFGVDCMGLCVIAVQG